MKKNKHIKYITIMLIFVMTLSLNIDINIANAWTITSSNKYFLQFGIDEVSAAPGTKIMTVTIPEGAINNSTLSKTVTIPNLKSVVSVSVNTGNVNYSVSGDKVTLNASSGAASRSVWDSTKYSKTASYVSKYDYTSVNNVPSTYYYNSGGYSGNIPRTSTDAIVVSGTPAGTMYVENQTSANYNDGVYSGTLEQYVFSGSYTPADTITATGSKSTVAGGDPAKLPETIEHGHTGYYPTTIGKNGSATVTSGSYTAAATKTATDSRSTNAGGDPNTLPETVPHGYTGYLPATIGKSGSATVTSGSYTAAATKTATDSRSTSAGGDPNTLPETVPHGYTGYLPATIGKSGSATVTSGSYTAAATITATDSRSTSAGGDPNGLPTRIPHSYPGYLPIDIGKSGSATMISGYNNYKFVTQKDYDWSTNRDTLYTKGQNAIAKPFTMYYDYLGYKGTLYCVSYTLKKSEYIGEVWRPSDGYDLTLTFEGQVYCDTRVWQQDYRGDVTKPAVDTRVWTQNYRGDVTKPAVDTRVWTQNYKGDVTKPAVDTRVWTQNYRGDVTKPAVDTRVYRYKGNVAKPDTRVYNYNGSYSGTVYMGGYDFYYSYTATIEYIDNSDPVITVTAPSSNSPFSERVGHNTITVTGTVKDDDIDDKITVRYELGSKTGILLNNVSSNSGQVYSFSGSITVDNTIPEGIYTLKIIVQDDKGGTATKNITINIDKTVPTVTFTPNGNSTSAKTQSAKVTVTDSQSGVNQTQYQWTTSAAFPAGGTWTGFTAGDTITQPNGDGNYYLHVKATDKVGNTSQATSNAFLLDNTPPAMPNLSQNPLADIWTNKDVAVTITYSEDSSTKQFKIGSGGTWTTYTAPVIVASNNTIYARGIDSAGNTSDEGLITITNIDKIAPTVSLSQSPLAGSWTDGDVTITATGSDTGGSNVKEIVKPDNSITIGTSTTYTVPANGTYTFKVRDNAGNETTESITISNIDKIAPTVNPPTVTVNSCYDTTIAANATDSMSRIDENSYEYFRDGISICNNQPSSYTDTGLQPNTQYGYKYRVSDKVGNLSGYSTEIKKYTSALNPMLIKIKINKLNSITFEVIHNSLNVNIPETNLILKIKNTHTVKSESGWNNNSDLTVNELTADEEYDVYLVTRNGDKVENTPLKLTSSSDPPLTDKNGKPINEVISDKLPEFTLTTDINNNMYSENNNYNKIPIKGRVRDLDADDELYIKYTLDGVGGHTDKLLVTLTAAGEYQEIDTHVTVDPFLPEGAHTIRIWAEDDKGGKSLVTTKTIIIDKTGPVSVVNSLMAIDISNIKVEASAADAVSGVHETEKYMYNRNGNDITTWLFDNVFIDGELKANKEYIYKIKSKDRLDNIGDYSNTKSIYTLALNPLKLQLVETAVTFVKLKVINDLNNEITPETKIVLKEKDVVVSMVDWGKNDIKELKGLEAGKKYDIYLTTRNENKIENAEVKISAETIPLVGSDGKTIVDDIVTVVPVNQGTIKLIDTTVSTMTIEYEVTEGQEYQLYSKDADGAEVGRSAWTTSSKYILKGLKANTQYVPYVITRIKNSEYSNDVPPVSLLNTELAYTDAEGIGRARFTPGEDFITIELAVETLTNPPDTEYEIRNDVTGQTAIITQSNPIWENRGLSKESEYEYSTKVKHKNGKPSNWTRLIFENGLNNGKSAHTIIAEIEIPSDLINVPDTILNPGEIAASYNPNAMENKVINIDGVNYVLTKSKKATLQNSPANPVVNATKYATSTNNIGFNVWYEMKSDGTFSQPIVFNNPGFYMNQIKFKNSLGRETDNWAEINYLADWVIPEISAEKKIPYQSATSSTFTITVNATDNISPYLYYSIDNGTTWSTLPSGINDITFANISKSTGGILNNLVIKIGDLCGNVIEKSFAIWGILK